ncbi:MAG: asparagine synthase (glutamine-hydrolyzing) [Weeksellaceae bacterium]
MCGIAGFNGPKDSQLLRQMSTEMQHRGPDGEGFYEHADVSLLSRRLAIIDRKGGDQPIYNEDKSMVVVFNGEIYNYRELREELIQLGHKFKTQSDTEVIIHGYEEWGVASFDKLNGMFGIAIYDTKKKQLIVARDHFGIKPIYFADTKSGIIFASELKPILHSGQIKAEVNEKILYRYLKYRIHDENRETFFAGIHRLLPGEYMTIKAGKYEIKTFSTLETDLHKLSEEKHDGVVSEDQIKEFQNLLFDSVNRRLISEVPVGTCLSGGLDSSSMVAIVNHLLQDHTSESKSVGKKQNTFSAVFPGSANDEEKYIDELLSKTTNVTSHKVYPKPEEFFTDLEDFIRTQEEPTISTGPYAQYQVMREAHKHVTVLLDGQGADEMMAGYLPYYFVYLNQLYLKGSAKTLISELWSSRDILSKYFVTLVKQKLNLKKNIPVSSVLDKKFAAKHKQEQFPTKAAALKKRLIDDIFRNSLQSLLRYEDRNTMRFSIEGRVPFLDIRLLRYLFSLPEEAIIKHGWNKFILREAMKDYLPESIYKRRNKIGFTTPEDEWFIRMKNRIYHIFLSESFANRPYFNQPEVLKAFQRFIEGKSDDTMLFWRVLNVELWLREFIDPPSPKATEGQVLKINVNPGKKLEIEVDGKTYERNMIKTDLFQKGDDYVKKITQHVMSFLTKTKSTDTKSPSSKTSADQRWYVVVSEKIIAISQGRSYFIWDINPSWYATTLSKFVTRTPYGIGLGSPWTMQLAIQEVGVVRIAFAAFVAAITKPLGMKGVFYHLAGSNVSAIDGPTEYSLYPSNVSAKLVPKDPQKVAEQLKAEIAKQTKDANFAGAVVIDANDIGRNILGNATDMPDKFFEEVMRDNPMGQSNEQTPVVIVRQV